MYLLNAPPGRYAAVAAEFVYGAGGYFDRGLAGGGTAAGPGPKQYTYHCLVLFSGPQIQNTFVDLEPRSAAFIGEVDVPEWETLGLFTSSGSALADSNRR